MTDDEADRRLDLAMRFHRSRNFTLTVGSPRLEAMGRAVRRAGLVGTPDVRTGRIVVEPPSPATEDGAGLAREALGIVRRLYPRGYDGRSIARAIGATDEEIGHLLAGRPLLPEGRARELQAGLSRLDENSGRS